MFGIIKAFYPSANEALLIKAVPLNETHVAVVRGLPNKRSQSKCLNKKSSSERRYFVR